jgi:hypothetical protein
MGWAELHARLLGSLPVPGGELVDADDVAVVALDRAAHQGLRSARLHRGQRQGLVLTEPPVAGGHRHGAQRHPRRARRRVDEAGLLELDRGQ